MKKFGLILSLLGFCSVLGWWTLYGRQAFTPILQLEKGMTYIYDIDISSKGKGSIQTIFDNGGPSSQEMQAELVIQGRFEIQILDISNLAYKTQFKFIPSNLKYTVNEISQILPKNLQTEVSILKNGKIESFLIEKNNLLTSGSLFREIFSLLELEYPQEYAYTWTAFERNLAGAYPIEWTQKRQFSRETLHFIKKYSNSNSNSKKENKDASIDGEFNFIVDSTSLMFKRIEGKKHVINRSGKNVVNDTTMALTLNYIGSEKRELSSVSVFPIKSNNNSPMIKETLDGKGTKQMLELNAQASKIRGVTPQNIIDSFFDKDIKWDIEEHSKQYEQLKALFITYPEFTKSFMSALVPPTAVKGEQLDVLLQALVGAGTPEVQELFRETISQVGQYPQLWERYIWDLSIVSNPTQTTEDFFRQQQTDAPTEYGKRMALSSLSNVAHFLRNSEPQRTETIVKEIIEKLDDSKDDETTIDILNALGNIGTTSQLPAIERYLNHTNFEIKRKTYEALRFIDNEKAKKYLLNCLLSAENDLRIACAESLGFSKEPDSAFEIYKNLLTTEKDSKILQIIIKRITVMGLDNFREESIKALENYYNNCGAVELCNAAKFSLDSLKK
ncbi:MAG: HEAT repeat domain-containing protein [Oligoflexia bacterium]|nr:HEAT repeat domain-containing protein [Oligoflexia bacterium]